MFNSSKKEERLKLIHDEYDYFPYDYSTFDMGSGNGVTHTRSFHPANRVTLSWHNINVRVKAKKKSIFNFRDRYDATEQKQLLFNVSGEVRPGTLLAIMGASGAGKTTLLNVLTRRNLRQLDVEGEVQVNGELTVGESIASISAYVQQDDLFIGTLTVREHLVFQALLRMDKHLTYEERMKRVDDVILEMGLSKCKNTMIGVAGKIKGISGGEAKRLAFAAEVLTNPSLMFCDEPTSGLDSFMSQVTMSVLRHMSEGGRTIVCTIHQPSSQLYALFDNLLLIAEGRVAYMGTAAKATHFFEKVGLQCPINYNPADFFVQNLAIVPGREAKSQKKVKIICEQFAKERHDFESSKSLGSSFMETKTGYKSRYKASWCSQFSAVLWRSWISLMREPMLTTVRLIQYIVIGIAYGLVFFQQKIDEKGVMNINGALFLMLMCATYQNMLAVIHVFAIEQRIFLREHWNGMYRTDIYFFSKTITEVPMLIFQITLYTVIVYFMIGLNPSMSAFFLCLVILILISSTSSSFGYMISCVSSSLNVALSLSSNLIMPLILLGGFFLNVDSVPVCLIWLRYVSWFYYGFEAISINQWKDITNITCSTEYCPPDGKAFLQTMNFHEENFLQDIVMIIILMVGYRLLAFFALLYKSSQKT